ncbi:transcription elongation factor GreA [Patescibacteria group bacterium]|nr:transcription elongation factor GreA [Patescibacteria group bacterium]
MFNEGNSVVPKRLRVLMTDQGLRKLQDDLKRFKKTKRPALVARLANAREQGDLSENQDYKDAREELNLMDGQIAELESVIGRAEVVKTSQSGGLAGLGSQVTVKIDGQQLVYHLVGQYEANPIEQKISVESPLGQKLTGSKVGDKIEVEAPAGTIAYTIVNIE